MGTLLQIGLENAVAAILLYGPFTAAACFGPLKRRPAWVHGLWLLLLIKLIVPSPWHVTIRPPVAVAQIESPETGAADALMALADVETIGLWDVSTELSVTPSDSDSAVSVGAVLGCVWVGGAVIALVVTVVRVRRFHSAVHDAGETAEEDMNRRVSVLAWRLGLATVPAVVTVAGGVCPMVWPFGLRPLLVLPRDLWESLEETQRSTLLVHELAHLRRRDHWVRLLELSVSILYWWLPVVWWARRRLHQAEEDCCDAWVVWALPGSVKAYAEALLETVDYLSSARNPLPAAASGFGPGSQLKRRLLVIRRGGVSKSLGRGGALAVLGLAVSVLPWSPTWAKAQKPEESKAQAVESRVYVIEDGKEKTREPNTVSASPHLEIVASRLHGGEPLVAREKGRLEDILIRLKGQKDAVSVRGSKEAVEALENAITSLETIDRKGPDLRHINVIVKGPSDESTTESSKSTKPDSPETAAAKEKLQAELKALSAEAKEAQTAVKEAGKKLAQVHKRMAEAHQKLAQAEGNRAVVIRRSNTFTTEDMRPGGIVEYRLAVPGGVTTLVPDGSPIGRTTTTTTRNVNQDQRLNELEKKLDRLVEQLESLKKSGK